MVSPQFKTYSKEASCNSNCGKDNHGEDVFTYDTMYPWMSVSELLDNYKAAELLFKKCKYEEEIVFTEETMKEIEAELFRRLINNNKPR